MWRSLRERLALTRGGLARVVSNLAPQRGWASVLRATAVTTAVSVGIQFVTLGSGVILAHALGPEGRGELAIAVLWPSLLANLSLLGLGEALTYFAARESGRGSTALVTSLVVAVGPTCLAMVSGALLLPYLMPDASVDSRHAAFLYLLIIPLHPLTLYPAAAMLGRLQFGAFNVARLSPHAGYTLLLGTLWLLGKADVQTAVVASLGATALTALVCLAWAAREGYLAAPVNRQAAGELIAFGWKTHISNVAALVASRADLLILSLFASAASVGLYVVAGSIAGLMGLVTAGLGHVIYPFLVRVALPQLGRFLARLALVCAPIYVAATVLAVTLLPATVGLIFGGKFSAAEDLARVLVLAGAIKAGSGLLVVMLRASGHPLQSSLADVVGTIVLLALLLGLTPAYGALGAAVASTVSAAASLVVLAWLALNVIYGSHRAFASIMCYELSGLIRDRVLWQRSQARWQERDG